jgi:hypothetical protein
MASERALFTGRNKERAVVVTEADWGEIKVPPLASIWHRVGRRPSQQSPAVATTKGDGIGGIGIKLWSRVIAASDKNVSAGASALGGA